MGSIGRRLEVLEGGGCAVCGWGPDTEVEVVFDGPDEPREPTSCPACGRPYEIVIGWGDTDFSD